MSTITIDLENLTEEEQETVKRLSEKKKKPYWVPKKGEKYYYICDNLIIEAVFHINTKSYERISIRNCFRTREEAEEAKTRLQMQTKWKRLSLEAGEADNPWDGNHAHLFVFWNLIGKKLGSDSNQICFGERTYFPTANSLKAAIAELGYENVKKYILGVEG